MRLGSSVSLTRDLQTLFESGTSTGLSDRQLLERFLTGSEAIAASAFEALVLRHGPMVLRVCKGRLQDWNDAQDAFQATFLVMVKRSATIRRRDSVASWLYGVAQRVSDRARTASARRRAIEGKRGLAVAGAQESMERDRAEFDEQSVIVQDEVGRLPEAYRAVVVLCYWEGMSQEQAAAHLGCPIGTVRSRMARGKDLLRKRLLRRGVASGSVVEVEKVLGSFVLPAAVPNGLLSSVVQSATQVAAGRAIIDATSALVALLAREILRSMVMIKVKMAVVCFGVIGFAALGASMAPLEGAPRPKESAAKTSKQKAQPPLVIDGDYRVGPPDMLLVEVLKALPGRPISGERLIRPDGKISLGFYGDLYVTGLTIPEVKEKVVIHLKKFLENESLGLIAQDPETDEAIIDPETKMPRIIDPKATNRIFVDVTVYNSRNYYIQGEVVVPGRLPITGSETVLDAINFAGGLTADADHHGVMLYRTKMDGTVEGRTIDVDQIMLGDDLSTNYQLKSADRLVVPRSANAGQARVVRRSQSQPPKAVGTSVLSGPSQREDRSKPGLVAVPGAASPAMVSDRSDDKGGATLGEVARRLTDLERKLEAVVRSFEKRTP